MTDIVDAATRSRMMAGVRSKDTTPELLIRHQLHAEGFRYRLHATSLPGKPDLVLPKYRVAIFVNGCFWHWHGCRLSKLPSTRTEFWEHKLRGNRTRDAQKISELTAAGWRCAIIWECAIRGKVGRDNLTQVTGALARWIRTSRRQTLEIGNGL